MYSISGPQGTVHFTLDGDNYVVGVVGREVQAGGSPLVVKPSEPIGPVDKIDFGELYRSVLAVVA